jgi:hypothetical protein
LIKEVVGLTTTIINAFQKGKKSLGKLKITKRQIKKGTYKEENLLEIEIPLSKEIETRLNQNLQKLIDSKES